MNIIRNADYHIVRIEDWDRHCAFGYYSNQIWIDKEHIVLCRSSEIENFKGCELVSVNINTGEEIVLANDCANFHEYTSIGDILYYVSGDALLRVSKDGSGRELVCRCENMTFPHATKDGRYLNWQVSGKEDACIILDLQTGVQREAFRKGFEEPFPTADHMMICPTDPGKVFFAHEGTTYYVSNRLWLWEDGVGMRCIAKQRLDSNGNLGDCFGHESWSADGKGLYFVKYPCSPLPPTGICYVDTEGNQTEVLYGRYPYWHVCASPDGRFLAADTQSGEFSGVCLIDMENGMETMVAKAGYTWVQPSHPHPHFSPDGRILIWNSIRDGRLGVEFVKIKDIL